MYEATLGQLLQEYDLASSQFERVTQEVTNVLGQIPFVKQILAIKGISKKALLQFQLM
ncbi:hypothetical protein [Peribacillus frigoritolerans]|uniref:hypothetical protein n=1 Tax=Peribacillus frigoritolerans TaxID=450367 RepID=UPI0016471C85|nr:hypothetical protein [Peribacillus frigoritolerans]MED4695916.1 hypothetical protein [Peribacillus frigoritolerans]